MSTNEKDATKEAQRFKDSHGSTYQEIASLKSQLQEVIDDRINFKMKLEDQREKLELMVSENGSLKEKGLQAEEEVRTLLRKIKTLELVQMELERKEEQLKLSANEQAWVETQLRGKEGELEELKRTIANL